MFVALTDFSTNPYLIPSKPENANGLTAFIEETEKEILEKTLGLLFYREMVAGMNALPAAWLSTTNYSIGQQVTFGKDIYQAISGGSGNQPPSGQWVVQPSNKWLRLREGDTYMYESLESEWVGFKKALRPYVHALYLRDYENSTTATGQVKHVSQNSEPANPNQKIMKGYNRFSKYIGGNGWDEEVFIWEDYLEDSLYGYLYYNNTSFDGNVTPKGFTDFRSYLVEKFCFPGFVNTMNI